MKIIGNFGLPAWLLAIMGTVVGFFIVIRLHLIDNLMYFFDGLGIRMAGLPREAAIVERAVPIIEEVNGAVIHTGTQMALVFERVPPVNRAFNWVMHLLAPVADLVGDFFYFLAQPLHLTKQQITDAQGWRVVFTLAAILSAIGAFLGFYRSNFPRKYEFASRDYNLEKRLFGQRQA